MSEAIIKDLAQVDYHLCYEAMQSFTLSRNERTGDEIWLLEHPAVYTQGLNGKPEHLINTHNISVIETDRGGQVTYHGPGQLVVYFLFDLKRKSIGVKAFVHALEESVIVLLKDYGLAAARRTGAPGVYVDNKKIAALGIRVKRGCSYHGLALNIDMDLSPFQGINPCGFAGLEVTQLSDFGIKENRREVIKKLVPLLAQHLKFTYKIQDNYIKTSKQQSGPRAA